MCVCVSDVGFYVRMDACAYLCVLLASMEGSVKNVQVSFSFVCKLQRLDTCAVSL